MTSKIYVPPSQASLDSVQALYIAYMSSPADPVGLNSWAHELDWSNDLSDILGEFGGYYIYTDVYGDLENDVLINQLYKQLFNREADPDGLAFYTDRLETGEATLASIAKQIIDGAAQGSIDATILDNKVAAAHCITENINEVYPNYSSDDFEYWDAVLDNVGLGSFPCDELPYYGTLEGGGSIETSGVSTTEEGIFL